MAIEPRGVEEWRRRLGARFAEADDAEVLATVDSLRAIASVVVAYALDHHGGLHS